VAVVVDDAVAIASVIVVVVVVVVTAVSTSAVTAGGGGAVKDGEVVGGATLTVAAAVVDAPCFFRSSFQHLEQQSPVALLPKKPQAILHSLGSDGVDAVVWLESFISLVMDDDGDLEFY